MLVELWVRDLALVEEAHVEFGPGMNALTGETGAGKSLIVGALELVLGGRAAADLVRRGAERAEVVARFDTRLPPGLVEDADGAELVLRRVIAADGKSRAYVNDRPVTVGRLREIGDAVADLHGQHEHQTILRGESHTDYVDAFADEPAVFEAFAAAHAARAEAAAALDRCDAERGRTPEEREVLAFQLRELEEAELEAGEEDALKRERHLMVHAARRVESAGRALESLEGEGAAAGTLGEAARFLADAAALDDGLEPLRRLLEEAVITVQEAARDLGRYVEAADADPERLETVEQRLDLLARLRRKYQTDEAGLLARAVDLSRRLAGDEELARVRDGLAARLVQTSCQLDVAARSLSDVRAKAAARLGRDVTRELGGLGMDGARFRVALEPPRAGVILEGRGTPVGARGAETAMFVLAANPGEPEAPLTRVASGGEASRVLLALKTVLRRVDPVGVLVFDEIDAGIGGLVADAVGKRLAAVARERQVLVVTHLAVIAGRADRQVLVSKESSGKRTRVTVEPLEGPAREREIARMLAGEAGGTAALRAARALLAGGR